MATSEQNEDSSWGDGATQLPLVLAERLLPVALQLTGNILCGVVAWHLAQLDNTRASIFVRNYLHFLHMKKTMESPFNI